MSLLTTGAYKDAYERLIAKCTVLCEITNIRSVDGKTREDGSVSPDMDWVTFSLRQEAKTVDGETLSPGFYKDVGFSEYKQTNGDTGLETANRMSKERMRELVICALDLPVTVPDAHVELEKQGGPNALLHKVVGVEWSVGKGNRQNVDHFIKPAAFQKPA